MATVQHKLPYKLSRTNSLLQQFISPSMVIPIDQMMPSYQSRPALCIVVAFCLTYRYHAGGAATTFGKHYVMVLPAEMAYAYLSNIVLLGSSYTVCIIVVLLTVTLMAGLPHTKPCTCT